MARPKRLTKACPALLTHVICPFKRQMFGSSCSLRSLQKIRGFGKNVAQKRVDLHTLTLDLRGDFLPLFHKPSIFREIRGCALALGLGPSIAIRLSGKRYASRAVDSDSRAKVGRSNRVLGDTYPCLGFGVPSPFQSTNPTLHSFSCSVLFP